MGFTKTDFDLLFSIINKMLTELKPDQIKGLIDGDLEITLKEKSNEHDHLRELKELVNNISTFSSRKAAEEYLLKNKLLKKDLVALGEYLQIHVSGSDTKEQIMEKIIDATYGVKSRSKAIKGLDLKRK
ncbi:MULTISPECIES: hypothetical protein [Bacillus cereus group]|uniref:hypothetical protein n=1 Tax=Bacillus cereus group TaxID=86661 RepID=UPI0001DBFB73|nr:MULTISPECIES: hypothetical protein [Bacillus cereus group]HDR4495596.1 hypothetical protein [Bacillus cereus biovar anthracis]ADK08003.1 hypothetical protein BACI_c54580 [Bacillus cereus biovar anthracis str. CI]MDA1898268.1 hypothetical protein [Bacillus cereus group sp. BcHK28]MDA1902907.1 hypothetical protein [Bacillus cereus group sp. BcHK20]MDF0737753.1 hypothetical protein [Bacillus pacificus]